MKLVLQIAGGLVLAFIVILFVLGLGAEYQAQQVAKEYAEYQKRRAIQSAKTKALFEKKLEAKNRKVIADRKAKEGKDNIEWVNKNAYVDLATDSSRLARKQYIQNPSSNNISVSSSPPARIQPSKEDEANNVLILQKLMKKQNN